MCGGGGGVCISQDSAQKVIRVLYDSPLDSRPKGPQRGCGKMGNQCANNFDLLESWRLYHLDLLILKKKGRKINNA